MNAREAKKLFLTIIFVIISVSLHAQNPVQKGVVRTALRPDREIVYLSDVSIRQKGGHNTVLSGSDGAFEMVLPDTRVGGAFYLSSVRKTGYELADNATIGKAFTYSPEVPIEIVMLDSRAKQEDIIRITNNAYARAEKEYAKKVAALEQQLQDKTLSEESYRQQLQELQTGFEKYESLISDMAERYASTDYATIDSLNAAINIAIENADLERADSLISTVGSLDRLVRESQEAMANARERQKIGTEIVEQASRDITDIEDNNRRLGDLLYSKYSIALTRFETDSAAYYITLRAELDTTNVEWQNETGVFIHDYMADYDKAMMLYQRALNITVTKYGEKHPDVATSLNNIGGFYLDKGDYDNALIFFDKALKILPEQFGYNHPYVAASLNNIGTIHAYQNNYDNALDYYCKALNIRTKLFGDYHPEVARSLISIGTIYAYKGEYGNALDYNNKAIKILTELLGDNHLEVATSLNNIGTIYAYQDNYDNALDYCGKALNIRTKIFGDYHPEVARSLNNIGWIYSMLGNYNNALDYFDKALKIQTKIFESNHPEIATSLNYIGDIYFYKGDYDNALNYFDKALKIRIELFGDKHLDVAVLLNNIGMVYSARSDYGNALDYFDKALKIKTELLGGKHPDVATSLNNIGTIYSSLGNYDKALDYFDKAREIWTEIFGDNHSYVATSLNNIGTIYSYKRDYGSALEYLNDALKMRIELFGEIHPDVATSLNNIAMVYSELNDYDKALEYYNRALKIRTTLYGENAPDVISTRNNIYDCYTTALKTSQSYIQPYEDFISEIAFTVTIVSDDTTAADQGMSGEYYLLEFGNWSQNSFDSLYEKNTELKGKPKDILVMKDGNISEHHFEDTTGVYIGLKYVGKEEKTAISEAYKKWKRQHNHESGK